MKLSNYHLEVLINVMTGKTSPEYLQDTIRNDIARKLVKMQREQTTDLQDRIVEMSQAEIDNRS
jgi:hypothetical protein